MGMTCTECFKQTHSEPSFSGLGVEAITALCRSWLCDNCLDYMEELNPGSTLTTPKDQTNEGGVS